MTLNTRQSNSGFTLIELLVVVAIIGLLASVVLASLNTARAKARNARRVSDIRQIQLALEFHFDSNGQYPLHSNDSGCGCDYSHLPAGAPDFISQLEPTYFSKVPLDPVQNSGVPNLVYKYISDGNTYTLQFNMEPSGVGIDCPSNAPPDNPGGGALWCTVRS
jgi:prepilin-type N-terminal cleavage/methylation domain-containing protein